MKYHTITLLIYSLAFTVYLPFTLLALTADNVPVLELRIGYFLDNLERNKWFRGYMLPIRWLGDINSR